MAAHGGVIGMAPPAAHQQPPAGYPLQHSYLPQPAAPAPPRHHHHAPLHVQHPQHPGHPQGAAVPVATDAFSQPQAWSFATPHGMQLVQGGAPTTPEPTAAARVAASRRIRWETIVPAVAVLCFVAAAALFVADFDRITGKDDSATLSSGRAGETASDSAGGGGGAVEAPTAVSTEEARAVLRESGAMFRNGRFAQARVLLDPLVNGDAPSAAAVAMLERIDQAAASNRMLVRQLGRQQQRGQWQAVLGTLDQIEKLRPLGADLQSLRTKARSQLARQRAAARARASRRAEAPRTGGIPDLPTTVRPPASVPAGALPPRPDAPNTGGGGGGAGVSAQPGTTGGGGSGACHVHDGVNSCH